MVKNDLTKYINSITYLKQLKWNLQFLRYIRKIIKKKK